VARLTQTTVKEVTTIMKELHEISNGLRQRDLRAVCHHMNSLTSREREVVLAVAEGLSNKDIGRRLNLSKGTVKVHLHKIYSKLGVKNRTALVVPWQFFCGNIELHEGL